MFTVYHHCKNALSYGRILLLSLCVETSQWKTLTITTCKGIKTSQHLELHCAVFLQYLPTMHWQTH